MVSRRDLQVSSLAKVDIPLGKDREQYHGRTKWTFLRCICRQYALPFFLARYRTPYTSCAFLVDNSLRRSACAYDQFSGWGVGGFFFLKAATWFYTWLPSNCRISRASPAGPWMDGVLRPSADHVECG